MSLIIGAGLICLALLVSWWLRNFELVEEDYRTGISLEARRNPFLAAEFFLREMGTDVESVNGRSRLQELPPPTDILLVNEFDGNLSPERHEKLLDWIDAGGHIIITANKLWDEERESSGNRLLDEFGIYLMLAEDNEKDGLIDNTNIVVTVDFDGGDSAKVAYNKNYYLEDSMELATASVYSEIGAHLIQIQHGNGLITVMSDNNFLKNPKALSFAGLNFENNSIGENDHAYFLWLLLGNSSKVWLIYNIESPSISILLWQNAPEACIAFLVLIMFCLWSTRNRFGPPLPAIDLPRRNLLEHILMSANFEWHQDRSHSRVQHNRELVQHEISSKHPNIGLLEATEKCQGLANISGISPEKIHFALYTDWKGEREFIQLSNLLRTLRQKI